jgi:predicted amidohydrolase
VAVAQLEHSARADPLTQAMAAIAEAAAQGAILIAFPETWLPGYPAWLDVCPAVSLWDHAPTKTAFRRFYEQSICVPGAATEQLGQAAAQAGITVVMGASEREPTQSTLYNSLLTFGPDGALLNHHRKLMPTHTERLVWGLGHARGVRTVETPAGRVGGLVCWEHWMPLARQALHEAGEHMHVAAWPQVKEMNLVASRHYAFEGRCFVLCAGALMRARELPPELAPDPNLLPTPGSWVLRGGSCIIGPDGALLAGPLYEQSTILYADIDRGRITEESLTLDVTGHYARPDCFRLVRSQSNER